MHVPLRLQSFVEILFRAHKLLWYATDTICTSAYALVCPCRYTAMVAADGAGVGGGLVVPKARRRGEVERGEGTRIAE